MNAALPANYPWITEGLRDITTESQLGSPARVTIAFPAYARGPQCASRGVTPLLTNG
jgi:hypothetical protein